MYLQHKKYRSHQFYNKSNCIIKGKLTLAFNGCKITLPSKQVKYIETTHAKKLLAIYISDTKIIKTCS